MSLINDALKRAKQAPPRTPNALPPLQPVADESSSALVWLIPALVILLIVAAIFFIGLASAHHTIRTITAAVPPATTQEVAQVTLPVVVPQPEPPAPVKTPDIPKLQGIFYSATAPTAILDGKTVGPDDQIHEYRVKEITKYTVTLVGPDGKEHKVGMSY